MLRPILDSLRPLETLSRESAVWRPVIDAAKNFALLEGLASGSIRGPVTRTTRSPSTARRSSGDAAIAQQGENA